MGREKNMYTDEKSKIYDGKVYTAKKMLVKAKNAKGNSQAADPPDSTW